jgi:hypothetical protein
MTTTTAVVGLSASYLALAVLLLSLNLRSAWRWPVKAGAIVVTIGCLIAGFLALEAMLGRPTEAAPPARFRLHAALVEEPDRANPSAGAIYLWLSPHDAAGRPSGPPRAHALPYSRALHEQAARAQGRLQDGRPVDGTAARQSDGYRLGTRAFQVELFAAPPGSLPLKAG